MVPAALWTAGTTLGCRRDGARRRCSRCGETDRDFFSHVRACPAVVLPAKVAVVAEDLVILWEPLPDDGQVKHGATAHLLPVSTAAAVHMIQAQEATIGLPTASTVRAVTV